jgi:putative membrane protein
MHLKLLFVALLIVYHFFTQKIMYRIQAESLSWTSTHLRLWNELATLFLVAIVFLVVLKSTLNWVYGTVGFFAVGIGLMLAVRIYKRFRS